MNLKEFDKSSLSIKTIVDATSWDDEQWYYFDVYEWTDEGEIIQLELITSLGRKVIDINSVAACHKIAMEYIAYLLDDSE